MDGLGQSIYSTFDEDKIIGSSINLGLRFSGADRCWAVKSINGEAGIWKSAGKQTPGPLLSREWFEEIMERLEKSGGTLLLNRYPNSSLARHTPDGVPMPGSLLVILLA